jgi:excisionase family DNA binding protein
MATPQPMDDADRLWTVAEIARFLQVHPKTIHRWRRTQALPCVVIGSRVRFRPSDVTKWVSARKEGASCRGL